MQARYDWAAVRVVATFSFGFGLVRHIAASFLQVKLGYRHMLDQQRCFVSTEDIEQIGHWEESSISLATTLPSAPSCPSLSPHESFHATWVRTDL